MAGANLVDGRVWVFGYGYGRGRVGVFLLSNTGGNNGVGGTMGNGNPGDNNYHCHPPIPTDRTSLRVYLLTACIMVIIQGVLN